MAANMWGKVLLILSVGQRLTEKLAILIGMKGVQFETSTHAKQVRTRETAHRQENNWVYLYLNADVKFYNNFYNKKYYY